MSGPRPGSLRPLTVPASWLYGWAVAVRNRLYDRGHRVVRASVPVVSVGNVTTGGAGKSPCVRWLARRLAEHGRRPVIAMRGYGARRGETSDEQAEHARDLPAVDVVADPRRAEALARYLPDHEDVDCVLLDDGFQHRRLHRDLDLVLIDASRPLLDEALLPAGHLREPLAALRRADAVVLTHADAGDARLDEGLVRWHGRPALARSRHAWTGLRLLAPAGPEQAVDVEWLRGRTVVALLGVGNPAAVLDQVARAGAIVAANVPARDHERYTAARLEHVRRLARDADAVLLTGKDWVKARHLIDLGRWPVPIVVPELSLEVFAGAAALLERVLAVVPAPAGR